MALVTGTPDGVTSQEEIYLEGAPYIYFQDDSASELFNPDTDDYYWGLSGTATYPVYNLGCVQDVSLSEDVTMSQIRCDNIGDKDAIQKRNYLELSLTILSLFPLSVLRHIIKAEVPTTSGSVEKMGIGKINNSRNYHIYMPKVYDEDTGDWLSITLHKAKFVDAFTLNMNAGDPWQLTGLKIRAFIDDTKPAGQEFATIIRADPSEI